MKKIILAVILMAAAGGVVYYFLQTKKSNNNNFEKELITGQWKIDSLTAGKSSKKNDLALLLFSMDSSARETVYDIQADGKILVSAPADSLAKKDTSSFSWGKNNEFLFKENPKDSTIETFSVIKLDKTELILQTSDSSFVYLKRK
jgi:hypothetical protein